MEEKLLDWYHKVHDVEGKKIQPREFKKQALIFAKNKSFRASEGWLNKFKKRKGINFK